MTDLQLQRVVEQLWASRFAPFVEPDRSAFGGRARFSLRLRACAGFYRPAGGGEIVVSRWYYERYGPEELQGTLLHELCHHAVASAPAPAGRAGRQAGGARARTRPHGQEFRALAAQVGAPRYCLPTPQPDRPHRYRCPNGHEVRRARRLRPDTLACGICCRAHAGGRFDRRFLLRPVTTAAEQPVGGEP